MRDKSVLQLRANLLNFSVGRLQGTQKRGEAITAKLWHSSKLSLDKSKVLAHVTGVVPKSAFQEYVDSIKSLKLSNGCGLSPCVLSEEVLMYKIIKKNPPVHCGVFC